MAVGPAHAEGNIFSIADLFEGPADLRELIDVLAKTAAKVGGFVLRDNVLAAKTLKESVDLVVSLGSLGLVGHLAHAANGVAGCFGPVTVLKSSFLRLANSF